MNTDLFDFSEEDKASIERSWQYWLDTGVVTEKPNETNEKVSDEVKEVFEKHRNENFKKEKINQLHRLCRGVNSASRANIKPAPTVIFVKENQNIEEAPLNDALCVTLMDKTHITDLPCEVDREHIVIDYIPTPAPVQEDKQALGRFSRAKIYLDDIEFIKESCEIKETEDKKIIYKGMKMKIKNKEEYNEIYLVWSE